MTTSPPGHRWAVLNTDTSADDQLPASPEPYFDLRCHRQLRGPYTGGGSLLRSLAPELLEQHAELLTARSIEIAAVAPELIPLVPPRPRTLTEGASSGERTRFYSATRTRRIANGVAELLTDWARALHPDGVVIAFRELDEADPTDYELVSLLLRRCDPRLVTLVVETGGAPADPLGGALAAHAQRAARLPQTGEPAPDADPAQLFIDSDGTGRDPASLRAYAGLAPDERARRHTERAEALAALDEPTLRLGAIPYHLEHGTDPANAGGAALLTAHNECYDRGFYDAALDLAIRARKIISVAERPDWYWNLTQRACSCLCYLERCDEALSLLASIRRDCTEPDGLMNCCYQMAMIYTRHLPRADHDHERAQEWANLAIAIADRHTEQKMRVFYGAFMRNARALVELHRGNTATAMSLVNEAIQMTDGELDPDEHQLHRSVLVYNRAQLLASSGDHAAAVLDYDEVISRDPDYGDYYFERATERRAVGDYPGAMADYDSAIRLSLPFHEAHVNRADLLRELGDEDGALRDLDYAAELKPANMDSLINRADLLLARGDLERARADIDMGLSIDQRNVHLLAAKGTLLADSGDAEAAFAYYTEALREDPSFVAAWANRAVLSYTAGRTAEAVDDLDHAIQLADDDWALHVNRAVALQDLGEHARALRDLDAAVAASGDPEPDLLYRRGVVRYELHDIDGAVADWRAHLAAYGQGEVSPYISEIQLRGGDLMDTIVVPESVA
jgi:tetratricopeptide (TPR) repeat protein